MTHEERLELIYAPFFIETLSRSYLWSGTIIGDSFPKGRNGQSLLHDDDGNRITGFQVFTVEVAEMLEAEAVDLEPDHVEGVNQ